jgi:hypothetical protein
MNENTSETQIPSLVENWAKAVRWGGLYLRETRLHELLPFRRQDIDGDIYSP